MKTIISALLAILMLSSVPTGILAGIGDEDTHLKVTEGTLDRDPVRSPGLRGPDWPMFRHDLNGTANTSSLIPSNNVTQWTFDTGDKIQSTPAIANGVVYFGSYDGNLYAVWANNGSEKWNFTAPPPAQGISSSPAVDDDKVYFHAFNGRIYCLWNNNGTEVWNVSIGVTDNRQYGSPMVVNDSVYIANKGGTVYSFDKTDGTENWNTPYGAFASSTVVYDDGKIFLGIGSTVVSLWASNGTEFWSFSAATSVYSSPALANGMVFATAGNPSFIGCSSGGRIYAIYQSNGTEKWSTTGAQGCSSPAISGDKVFIASQAYYQSNGTLIWDHDGRTESSPSLSGNKMVAINSTKLTTYFQSNGTIIWEKEVDGWFGSPTLANDMVFVGGKGGTLYAIGAVDTTPPNVTSTDPPDMGVDISLSTNMTITFSESMDEALTESAFSITPVVQGQFSWNGYDMTFDPDNALGSETLYTVKVDATAEDLSGNTLDGDDDGTEEGSPTDDHSLTFTTIDATPPNVTSTSPADQEVDIQPDVVIDVVFSEPMNMTAAESAFDISPSTTGSFSWSGDSKTMTFTPDANLVEETVYNCSVQFWATDLIGNLLDGNADGSASGDESDNHTWSFTVKDWIPPQVTDHSPGDGLTQVPINTIISVTFSEPMDTGATEAALGIDPATTGSMTWSGDTLTFTPSSQLGSNTLFKVTVATSALDLAGNALDGNGDGVGGQLTVDDVTWTFTTGDVADDTPPFVVSVQPDDGHLNVPVDTEIRVEFSEPMDKPITEAAFSMTPSITGSMAWDGANLTYTPQTNLTFETVYTMRLASTARDVIGLELDANDNGVGGEVGDEFSWTFTTVPVTGADVPPEVVDLSPNDGEVNVSKGSSISITFSMAMAEASVESAFSMDPTVTGNFSWFGDTVTYTPDGLDHGTTYSVALSGASSSLDGIGLDGNKNGAAEGSPTDDLSWSFTVEQEPPPPPPTLPRVVSVLPKDGSVDVPVDSGITIVFSETMNPTATEDALLIGSLSPVEYQVSWGVEGDSMVIDPLKQLIYGHTYHIKITGAARSAMGGSLDGNGNGLPEGLGVDDHNFNFTTEEQIVLPEPPVVTVSGPAKGDKVKGTVVIQGHASDVDTPIQEVKVEIMFDQVEWLPVGSGGDWNYTWDTKEVKNGKHTFKVRAYDGGRYSEVVEIEVQVENKVQGRETGGLDTTWMIILVVAIIITVVLILMSMKMRKKGAPDGTAPGTEVPQGPPPMTEASAGPPQDQYQQQDHGPNQEI